MFGPEPDLKRSFEIWGYLAKTWGQKGVYFEWFSTMSRLNGKYLRNEIHNWQRTPMRSPETWKTLARNILRLRLCCEVWSTLCSFHIFLNFNVGNVGSSSASKRNSTKLCRMFGSDPDFKNDLKRLGSSLSWKVGSLERLIFVILRQYTSANIFWTKFASDKTKIHE